MKKEVGAKSQINHVTIIELEESTELESELQLEEQYFQSGTAREGDCECQELEKVFEAQKIRIFYY
jgi:hypothetical protein